MNFDIPTPAQEKDKRIPSLEEIRYQIKKFIDKSGLRNPQEQRVFAEGPDGKDLYLYEISATDSKGDAYLYQYKRAGKYPHLDTKKTEIGVVFYDGSLDTGYPIGGDTPLSVYDESTGKWNM
jgi:hypothetical protein